MHSCFPWGNHTRNSNLADVKWKTLYFMYMPSQISVRLSCHKNGLMLSPFLFLSFFFSGIFISDQINLLTIFDINSVWGRKPEWMKQAIWCNKPFWWDTVLLWIEVKGGCLSFMETIWSWNEHKQKLQQPLFLITKTSWEREMIPSPPSTIMFRIPYYW